MSWEDNGVTVAAPNRLALLFALFFMGYGSWEDVRGEHEM